MKYHKVIGVIAAVAVFFALFFGFKGNDNSLVTVPFGVPIDFASVTVQVNGFEEVNELDGLLFEESMIREDQKFVIVDVTVTNISNESFTFYPDDGAQLVTTDDARYSIYELSSGGSIGYVENRIEGRDLGPHIPEQGFLLYEIPNESKPYAIYIEKSDSNKAYMLELSGAESEITNTPKALGKALPFRIIEDEETSYAGCNRLVLRVTVPDGSSQVDVDYTLERAIGNFTDVYDDITIFAWSYSEEYIVGDGPFTKGMKEYSTCN